MTGIILAGGKNKRMGTNKAFLSVEGELLIDRTIRTFKDVFQEIIVVTNTPLDYLDQDCVIATDIIKEKGALAGIYTGLVYASHDHVFVSACDMPFLNKAFMAYMIKQCRNDDVVVPEMPDGLQPLHAIYSRRCLPIIQRSLQTHHVKIIDFYREVKTKIIPQDTIKTFDPEGRMFCNLNTQNDLEQLSSTSER